MDRSEELSNILYESAKATVGNPPVVRSWDSWYDEAQYEQACKIMGWQPGFGESVNAFIEDARTTAMESGYTKGLEVILYKDVDSH